MGTGSGRHPLAPRDRSQGSDRVRLPDKALVRRGMLYPAECDACRRAVEELAAADRYFYGITVFVYAGRRR